MKICPGCKSDKDNEDFITRGGKKSSYCLSCRGSQSKIYYKKNPEKRKIYKKNYESKEGVKTSIKKYLKQRYDKIKNDFLEMYGNKCDCCGESLKEFLTIDHVQGQRGIKRKELSMTAYRKALKKYDPNLYRILCMNCNHSIGIKGYCPHQSK